jgi:hypothetical protein
MRWIERRRVPSAVRITVTADPEGLQVIRVEAAATIVRLPDVWLPSGSATDPGERPALVADPDRIGRGLRWLGMLAEGPRWDADRWGGLAPDALPRLQHSILANTLDLED